MKQEDKELLLKDLCSRIPYGVKILAKMSKSQYDSYKIYDKYNKFLNEGKCIGDLKMINNIGDYVLYYFTIEPCGEDEDVVNIKNIKPYLRPLETITKEERIELGKEIQKDKITPYGEIKDEGVDNLLLCTIRQSTYFQEWLLSKHFDFRGLIEKGLALVAPEGMYN